MNHRFRHFRFWCQSVLPLVYDDSLSYYEVLCKVVNYINKLIDDNKEIIDMYDEIKEEVEQIQEWIDNFDEEELYKIIEEYIATMVFFGLTNSGYFVAYIPESWESISFETTGYDTFIDIMPEYGHLVLKY